MGKNMRWKREHWLSEPHDHPTYPEIYLLITYSCSKGACHSCFIFLPRSQHGLPGWFSGKEHTCKCRRCRFDSWVRKIPCWRKWQPTPVFSHEKPHRQRSQVGLQSTGWQKSQTPHSNYWKTTMSWHRTLFLHPQVKLSQCWNIYTRF